MKEVTHVTGQELCVIVSIINHKEVPVEAIRYSDQKFSRIFLHSGISNLPRVDNRFKCDNFQPVNREGRVISSTRRYFTAFSPTRTKRVALRSAFERKSGEQKLILPGRFFAPRLWQRSDNNLPG